jgi:carboxyl-terminal processing protease
VIRRGLLVAALLVAAPAGAQVLDDTRGLGAQRPPPPADLEQLRRIAEVVARVKGDYVDVLEDSFLAERCIAGMDKALGAKRPRLAPLARGAKPTVERIAEYWRELGRGTMQSAELEALGDACLHGMVDELDRRTAYLGREAFRELQVGSAGAMGGLGLELEQKDGHTLILEAIEGAPAASLDLRPGDRILAVDGESVAGLKLDEVVKRMRGKVGSPIVLTLGRAGSPAPLRVEGQRQIVRVHTVRPRQLEGGVLYVRVTAFHEATLESLYKALAAGYAAAGAAFRGIVLDLRGNPGGLLHTCIGIAAAFLPDKTLVVETKGRTEDNSKRFTTQRADWDRGGWMSKPFQAIPEAVRKAPLVVLVDKRSAACSEIVAAAVQDHRRGQVIGEKTFGLGTVQTIIPLAGSSALRLTTARFYRPEGGAIEDKGVTPDAVVAHPERFRGHAAADDPALPAALKALAGR